MRSKRWADSKVFVVLTSNGWNIRGFWGSLHPQGVVWESPSLHGQWPLVIQHVVSFERAACFCYVRWSSLTRIHLDTCYYLCKAHHNNIFIQMSCDRNKKKYNFWTSHGLSRSPALTLEGWLFRITGRKAQGAALLQYKVLVLPTEEILIRLIRLVTGLKPHLPWAMIKILKKAETKGQCSIVPLAILLLENNVKTSKDGGK